MLRRTMGEDVALEFSHESSLPAIHGDSGMIEQVVVNLAVNARDAMPEGGKLRIATSLVELDAAQAARHSQAQPGRFACLTVTAS